MKIQQQSGSYKITNSNPRSWHENKVKLMLAFQEKGVMDLVRLDPEHHAGDPIVETTLQTPMPSYQAMVDDVLVNNNNNILQLRADNMTRVWHMYTFGTNEFRDREFAIEAECEAELAKNQRSRPVLESQYHARMTVYETERDKFTKRQRECLGVFVAKISEETLRPVYGKLNAGQYRAAFQQLDRQLSDVNRDVGINGIQTMLVAAIYDPNKGMSHFIDKTVNLYEQLAALGLETQDEVKRAYIINKISNSNSSDYDTLLETIEFRTPPLTLMQVIDVLHGKEAKMASEKAVRAEQAKNDNNNNNNNNDKNKNNNNNKEKYKNNMNLKNEETLAAAVNSNKQKCRKCGKTNHSTEKCWAGLRCENCGGQGHIARVCLKSNKMKTHADDKDETSNSTSKLFHDTNSFNKRTPNYTNDLSFDRIHSNSQLGVMKNPSTGFSIVDKTRSGKYPRTVHTELPQDVVTIGTNCWGINNESIAPGPCCDLIFSLAAVDLYDRNCAADNQATLRVIIDSGATSHMFSCRKYLLALCAHQGVVTLGDKRSNLRITGVGKTHLHPLHDVYFVPDLRCNVISQSALDRIGCIIITQDGIMTVYDSAMVVVMSASLEDGLYYLDDAYIHILTRSKEKNRNYACGGLRVDVDTPAGVELVTQSNAEMDHYQARAYAETVADDQMNMIDDDKKTNIVTNECIHNTNRLKSTTFGLNPLEALHREYGHLGAAGLKRALHENMVTGCRYKYDDIKNMDMPVCIDCQRGRMKASSSSDTGKGAQLQPLEKIAIDFKGLFPVRSVHGYRGFFLLCDRATGYGAVILTKSKEGVASILRNFKNEVVDEFNHKWKILQADYDRIFTDKGLGKWLKSEHVRLQLSAPYYHSQNGQIEHYVGNVMDKARTLMLVYSTPRKFWEYAVKHAVYLINISPVSGRDQTPLEAITGMKPDISDLVPFYAPGVYHLTREERRDTAWDPKAEPCRFLGFDPACKNGYVILNMRTRRIVTRKDCIFDERLSNFPINDDYEENDSDADSDEEDDIEELLQDQESCNNADSAMVVTQLRQDNDHPYGIIEHEVSMAMNYITSWYNDASCYAAQTVIALPTCPRDVDEAMAGPYAKQWEEAILKELEQFDSRHTLGDAEQHGRALKTKMVLSYTYDNNYNVKCKARWVICGYGQIRGVDYNETYAPTTTSAVVFILLHLCGMYKYRMAIFDVSSAFLEGKQDIPIFVWLPDCMTPKGSARIRKEVLGNWYGTKQGPKIWNDHLDRILVAEIGLTRCPVHPCLYYVFEGDMFLFLTVHVDDGQLVSNSDCAIERFTEELSKHLRKVQVLTEFKKFLGMDINNNNNGGHVVVSHENYIQKRFGDHSGRIYRTPMSNTDNLRAAVPNNNNESLLPLTGTLRFPADRARPDILVVTGELSSGAAESPSDDHVKVAARTISYLQSTKSMYMQFGGNGPLVFFGYCDSSYNTEGNSRCRLGGCLFWGFDAGAILSWCMC